MNKQYLTHDFGARNDPKLLKLQMDLGGVGLAIYWCIVEMLWENDGYLPLESNTIAFSLRWATADEVQEVILNYNLFDNDGDLFWSPSATERIEETKRAFQDAQARAEEASQKGRNAANMRWRNTPGQDGKCGCNAGADATAMQPQCAGNALQTNKQTNYTNKQTVYIEPPTAADKKRFLEIFFFDLNCSDPAGEVQRFIDHYSSRGWVFGDGTPVVDRQAAARKWTPEDKVKGRLPKTFLQWYKMIYASAGDDEGLQTWMLTDLAAGTKTGNEITITMRRKETAVRLSEFIRDNIKEQYNIQWKLRQ